MARRAQPKEYKRTEPKRLPREIGQGQRVNVGNTAWDLHKKQASGKVFGKVEGQWNG